MKKTLFALLALGILLTPALAPTPANAFETGLSTTARYAGLGDKPTSVPVILGRITQAVLGFVGFVFFAMITYGGILWMTAGGNEERVKKAQKLITQSVIGLVIITSAYAITSYVVNKAIGQSEASTGDSTAAE